MMSPRFCASDAENPFIMAGRVRFSRFDSTNVSEKTCFRCGFESADIQYELHPWVERHGPDKYLLDTDPRST